MLPRTAKKASIQKKLSLSLAVFFLILITVDHFLVGRGYKKLLENQMLTQARQTADVVGYAVDSFPNVESLQRYVSALGASREIEEIIVAWGDPLTVQASTRNQWFQKPLSEVPNQDRSRSSLAESARSGKPFYDLYHRGGQLIDFTLPITVTHPAQPLMPQKGAIMVHLDRVKVTSKLNQIWSVAEISLSLFSIFFALFFAWFMRRLIFVPLQKLSMAIKKRQQGDEETRLPVLDNDELGQLSSEFNALITQQAMMIKTIENQKKALDEFAIVAETDAEGKITYVNDQFCRISQYSREEALGQDHRIVNSGYHPKSFFENMWNTIASGKVWRGEIRNKAKDGSFYWVDSTIVPFMDKTGKPEKYLAIRALITQRKLAEAKVIKAASEAEILHQVANIATRNLNFEDALQETIQLVCTGIAWPVGHAYKINADGRGLEPSSLWYLQNPDRYAAFKSAADTFCFPIGSGLAGKIARSKNIAWVENIQNESDFPLQSLCTQNGLKAAFGFPIIIKNQVVAVLEFFMPGESKPDEDILKLSGDLSKQLALVFERKQASDAVEASRTQLQAILDSATEVSIIATDTQGTITLFNQGAEKMLGWRADEVVGIKTPEIVHLKEEVEERERTISQELGYPVRGFEVFVADARAGKPQLKEWHYVRKDGSRFPVSLYITAVYNSQKELTGFLGMATDMTKIKTAEHQLQEAVHQAREASRAKSEFLATMSHEIRTPMNAILGMADLLQDTSLTPDQKDYVVRLTRGGESLLHIINDVLDISKIEAGSMEIEKLDFDFPEQIKKTLDLLSLKIQQKGLALNVIVDPAIPVLLTSDPMRLNQILVNLLMNALKFTPAGSITLEIKKLRQPAEGSDSHLMLGFSVIDTGIGIPEHKIKNLFQPFTQVDSSTTRKFGGTGLGLNICKQLVERMGGQIGVCSTEGKGSEFYFILPFGIPDPALLSEFPSAQPEIRRTALVVDDQAEDRSLFSGWLQSWGWKVDTAENGPAAIRMVSLANEPYGLLLIDCRMPGMGGFEVAKKIRADLRFQAPMIALFPPHHRTGDPEAAKLLGFSAGLGKPLKSADLKKCIDENILHRQGEKKNRASVPTSMTAKNPGDQLRVLVADDSEDNQHLIRSYLKTLPVTIDEAETGKRACEKWETADYDLIFMDMQMPEMDGYSATRWIREKESESHAASRVPIIALTANALREDSQKCLSAGCDDYLTKPVKKSVLIEILQRFWRKKTA